VLKRPGLLCTIEENIMLNNMFSHRSTVLESIEFKILKI
jgi:hypothetical protein